jgi:DNA-binding NtrC family response regulator
MKLALSGLQVPFIVASAAMAEVVERARLYARWDHPAVLVGGTGTGKSLLARQMHEWSGRSGPFVDVTAGELHEHLAHDQLFGHEAGAFTGAVGKRRGLFAEAAQGTLLLDDFHLLPASFQPTFLRVLDRKAFRPAGADRDVPVQCRVLVGLREAPDSLVGEGKLLPDLRYRLGYFELGLPRLSERVGEVSALANAFLQYSAGEAGTGPTEFGVGVLARLEQAPWPGNVRQLRAVVEAAFVNASESSAVELEHLPAGLGGLPLYRRRGDASANQQAVEWALRKTGGNASEAARLIGAHRNTVSNMKNTSKNRA